MTNAGLATHSKNRATWLLSLSTWGRSEGKSIQILTFLSPLKHVPLPFKKTNVLHYDLKKDVWNKILNIKPCMGHISRTWELLLCEYWRKSMIIGEKNTDLKRLTGRLKLRFLTEIGRLHWNQGEEVAHFAWFGEPCHRVHKIAYGFGCPSEKNISPH